jgi:heat shock protein HslJ
VARWLLPLVLLALLPASASASSLTGTKWKVTRIAGDKVSEFNLTVAFGDGRDASGFDGCNHFSARYRVTGSRLRLRRFISTAIGCEGDTIPSLTQRLMRTRRFALTGRRLELRRAGRTLVVLRRR